MSSSACRGSSRSDAPAHPRVDRRLPAGRPDSDRGRRGLPGPHRRARRPGGRVPDRDAGTGAGRGARVRAALARRQAAGPARRRPGGPQGRALHARRADHVRLEDARGVRPALRRDGRRAAAGGGRGDPRQDQHGRVRDGLIHRALGLPPDAQPLGPRPRARGFVRRVGRGGRWWARRGRVRERHGRLDPSARGLLWCGGHEADVRPRVALRPDRSRVLARPDRAVRPRRQGRRALAGRGRRPRPARRDVHPGAGARLRRGAVERRRRSHARAPR